mmetsp:Transcript_10942/g.30714  ORF Transcript_10942/g.30714 Transcript_10942/m.30714 type:complete len:118 (-) Transcript_10942:249-602(-)
MLCKTQSRNAFTCSPQQQRLMSTPFALADISSLPTWQQLPSSPMCAVLLASSIQQYHVPLTISDANIAILESGNHLGGGRVLAGGNNQHSAGRMELLRLQPASCLYHRQQSWLFPHT